MSSAVKKIWDVFTTVIVVILAILAILLVGVRFIGLTPYSVLSGSMEPTYMTGSLIYVKEVDSADLKSGDVITFLLDDTTTATHRIVKVIPDEKDKSVVRFQTKGDANEIVDSQLVHSSNVLGTPVASIPQLGYFAMYIQTVEGRYASAIVGAILLILIFIPDILKSDSKIKEKVDII